MAATLETLPRECLEETLLYLDARDVVAAMATSRAVLQVAGGERVWRELAFRDFGVCEPPGEETAPASTPEGDALEGARWRALHHDVHVQLRKNDAYQSERSLTVRDDTPYDARCPPDEMRALRARGVFCDGGVDENDPENWFGQVFELEGASQRFYCSAASSDVHLVGCFAEGDVHCAWRADAARHSRRRFMALRCSTLAHVLERLSAQSSLAPADQRDFQTILKESRALPPYDFTAWPHDELGSFFTHYVSHYRPDDPVSQLFFDEASPSPKKAAEISDLREVARLHEKDQQLEARLHDYDDPLTHVEPLPEAEVRLYEYLFDRQPDNEQIVYLPAPGAGAPPVGGRARRSKDDASAKRRAETPGRELLDLFAENAAMHAFSDAFVRVDSCDLDNRLEPGDAPVWRTARRRARAAEKKTPSSRTRGTREEAEEEDDALSARLADQFGFEDVEAHAGCVYFSGGDSAIREIESSGSRPALLDREEKANPVFFVADSVFTDPPNAKRRDPRVLPAAVSVRRWRQMGAVVSTIELDRTGAFTCPVSAGAVFFSPGPPSSLPAAARARLRAAAPAGAPPMSGDARAAALGDWARNAVSSPRAATARLRGIDTLEKLEAAAREGSVPKIVKVTALVNGVVAEFEPPSSPSASRRGAKARFGAAGDVDGSEADAVYDAFAPAVWFRFHARESLDPVTRADPRRDVLRYRLRSPRWSRAHCVKLIAPENLMREWEDDHPAPNLDFRRFAAFGASLALSDHEVGGRAFVSSAEPKVFTRTPGVDYGDDSELSASARDSSDRTDNEGLEDYYVEDLSSEDWSE